MSASLMTETTFLSNNCSRPPEPPGQYLSGLVGMCLGIRGLTAFCRDNALAVDVRKRTNDPQFHDVSLSSRLWLGSHHPRPYPAFSPYKLFTGTVNTTVFTSPSR